MSSHAAVSADDDDKALQIQALQSAIWYTTEQIVNAESQELGVVPSSSFVASLSTLVYSQINTLGEDIESFAKHRGGKVVNVDDVLVGLRFFHGIHHTDVLSFAREEMRVLYYELMVKYAKHYTAMSAPEPRTKGKQKENIREAVKENAKSSTPRI
ncbi:hypothetical protein PORY_001325 [Pneumocystis oryctolagi]|uniref:Uncharacterized protein n=1 Tax=Pneumocystis oryctolagi TaxID=42067 RepID=A0ACB7CDL9_9ASCO|nr:hypothetical protein PORY_001325 [Pneumocystis oryctolagi]